MGWQIEDPDDVIFGWLGSEPDADLREFVLSWLPAWADDPESFPFMPVPGTKAAVYVTFVPETAVGVKFFAATQFKVLRVLAMRTVTDL